MGARYREYLQSKPSQRFNTPGYNGGGNALRHGWEVVGIGETIKAFEQIRDTTFRQRKLVTTIRSVLNQYYLPTVRGLAHSMGPNVRGDKLAKSFGFIDAVTRPYLNNGFITVRAGARAHTRYEGQSFFPDRRGYRTKPGSKRKQNYGGGGWLAAFWEYGTDERERNSGGRTGHIPRTGFASLAFTRTEHVTGRMLTEKIGAMMDRAVKKQEAQNWAEMRKLNADRKV